MQTTSISASAVFADSMTALNEFTRSQVCEWADYYLRYITSTAISAGVMPLTRLA